MLKKSVKLFKSSIIGMTVIRKGDGRKVPQQAKIKPLHRFEMGKEGKCLILPAQMHRQGYWAN